MWMLKSLKLPPLAHKKLWKRWIWYISSVMPGGFGSERKNAAGACMR
jgi:hypothetical protein